MLTISKLFGRSPFTPLQAHMDKVANCVDKLNDIFSFALKGEFAEIEELARRISKLEHEADEMKNEIRNNLPRGIFLPIDRGQLLEILALQDSIADLSEDIAVLLTFRPLPFIEGVEKDFSAFLEKNMEAYRGVQAIISQLDELIETSFGGAEAERVQAMVAGVAQCEHEVDLLQRKLLKHLYTIADEIPHWSFSLWMRIFERVGDLSNVSERLAYRVRMTLELK